MIVVAAAIAASVDWIALPAASYDSDIGVAGGAVSRVQWVGDRRPYDAMLGAQILFSSAGMQSHYLRLDVPGLFGGGFRLRASAEFHREIAAPYYGTGNRSPDPVPADLVAEHAFEYRRTYPEASVSLGAPLGGSDMRLTALVRYLRLRIDPYAGSLLALQRPTGAAGGDELSYGLGLLLDRRDDQAAPSRGYLLEAALRGATSPLSPQSYAGATVRALGFVPLADRVVLAGRLESDVLTRGAPLFELSRFGGVDPVEGIGGSDSVRGVPRERYIGRGKVVASAELRVRTLETTLLQRRVSVGVVAFVDTGRVWQGQGDGAFFDFHTGGGAGLRLRHREMVVRLDFATSADRAFSAYFALGSSF